MNVKKTTWATAGVFAALLVCQSVPANDLADAKGLGLVLSNSTASASEMAPQGYPSPILMRSVFETVKSYPGFDPVLAASTSPNLQDLKYAYHFAIERGLVEDQEVPSFLASRSAEKACTFPSYLQWVCAVQNFVQSDPGQCYIAATKCIYTSVTTANACAVLIAGTAGLAAPLGCKNILGKGGNLCADANVKCGIESSIPITQTAFAGSSGGTGVTINCSAPHYVTQVDWSSGSLTSTSATRMTRVAIKCSDGTVKSAGEYSTAKRDSWGTNCRGWYASNTQKAVQSIGVRYNDSGDLGIGKIKTYCDDTTTNNWNSPAGDDVSMGWEGGYNYSPALTTSKEKDLRCQEGRYMYGLALRLDNTLPAGKRKIIGINGICR
ncbi:MAG: hypothetical protein KDI60_21290 [Xanthomonadales bacterium]|nr:hypothetical protein [Xanthomonadales bacterium]MCB1614271.1 hypothetical protein [Xanthomonadales bacterium]